jgi:endonuclease/exonuclease/phosphatase family metal-dependent hydrolase
MNAKLIENEVARLTPVSQEARLAMREGPRDGETHSRLMTVLPALHEIEVGGRASRQNAGQSLRVVAWNVERLRYGDAIGETLRGLAPDVVLLSEVDKGMARTGNGHPLATVAERLGHAFAYGVEFVELDAGSDEERAAAGDTPDEEGFHGNAVTSAVPLMRPFMIRFDLSGRWFAPEPGQPRIGGRMAIGGQVRLGATTITLVSVHLDNRCEPEERAEQTRILLDAIDQYDAAAPVLIGGDFNTLTAGVAWKTANRAAWDAELKERPERLIRVEPYEPLFKVMAGRGYDWKAANTLDQPTQRRSAEMAHLPTGRIDWFFTRGLEARDPAVIPAVLPDGSPSSDHEALLVTVSL